MVLREVVQEGRDRLVLQKFQGTDARIRISTGDHRDPIRPEEAELIVATYESFAAVLQRSAFRPGTIVADEIHLIADRDRGPGVEGLFAHLLSKKSMGALRALSAVILGSRSAAPRIGRALRLFVGDDSPGVDVGKPCSAPCDPCSPPPPTDSTL